MANMTSGYIESTETKFDNQTCNLSATINGTLIDGYNLNKISVLNPCGFFSRPVKNKGAMILITPGGTTGFIHGFINEAPETSQIRELEEGESAICETQNHNFNVQAKLNGVISKFKNSVNAQINTKLPISENIVTMLTDIMAEIIALKNDYNQLVATFNAFIPQFAAHTHSGVQSGSDSSGGTTAVFPTNTQHTPISNFTRDYTFINQTPSKMYVNIDGANIS